jgi:hypothetical protein
MRSPRALHGSEQLAGAQDEQGGGDVGHLEQAGRRRRSGQDRDATRGRPVRAVHARRCAREDVDMSVAAWEIGAQTSLGARYRPFGRRVDLATRSAVHPMLRPAIEERARIIAAA